MLFILYLKETVQGSKTQIMIGVPMLTQL